jgi:hypothetical protein
MKHIIRLGIMGLVTFTGLTQTYAQTNQRHNKSTMKQLNEHVMTLGEAIKSFGSYMHMLKAMYGYPRTPAAEQGDIISTKLTLEEYATGSRSNDLVPVSKVIELKDNYRAFLKQTHPEYFSKRIVEKSIPRHLAEIRLRLVAFKLLNQRQRRMAKGRWNKLKHLVVVPMLDHASFTDSVGVVSISPEDFQTILMHVRSEATHAAHLDSVYTNARYAR